MAICRLAERWALDLSRRQETYRAFYLLVSINLVAVMVVYLTGAWLISFAMRRASIHLCQKSRGGLQEEKSVAVEEGSTATGPTPVNPLQVGIVRLARRMCFLMCLTLLFIAVFYMGAAIRSVPVYYLGATAGWITANVGSAVSIVIYSRQAHRAEHKPSTREHTSVQRTSGEARHGSLAPPGTHGPLVRDSSQPRTSDDLSEWPRTTDVTPDRCQSPLVA
jgi:hypothetical protein